MSTSISDFNIRSSLTTVSKPMLSEKKITHEIIDVAKLNDFDVLVDYSDKTTEVNYFDDDAYDDISSVSKSYKFEASKRLSQISLNRVKFQDKTSSDSDDVVPINYLKANQQIQYKSALSAYSWDNDISRQNSVLAIKI